MTFVGTPCTAEHEVWQPQCVQLCPVVTQVVLPLGWHPSAGTIKGYLGVFYHRDDGMAQPRKHVSVIIQHTSWCVAVRTAVRKMISLRGCTESVADGSSACCILTGGLCRVCVCVRVPS
jgi:hypothetical protein